MTTPHDSVCATPGCTNPSRARGLCTPCYYQRLRAGEITAGSQTPRFRHRLSDIDTESMTAICAACGPTKIHRRSPGPRNVKPQYRCATDVNHRSKLYKRAYRAVERPKDKECAICGATENLRWDHNHATEAHRGTLCNNCNTGLGMFADSSELLARATEYLMEHGEAFAA